MKTRFKQYRLLVEIFLLKPPFQVVLPSFPSMQAFYPQTWTQQIFYCFFFQNPAILKNWHAFSNPHWQTWQYVTFFVCFFHLVFSFLDQGHIMYIQMLYSTEKDSRIPSWSRIWVTKEKLYIKDRYMEDVNVIETEKRSTDQTTCYCAWNDIPRFFFFRSNKIHAQSVLCHTDNPNSFQRARLLEYNM